jgi:predicted amidohydrolase YtcJ
MRASLLWLFLAGLTFAQGPDTVLLNGKIITVDSRDAIVEAVSIKDGKIVAAGTTAAIRRSADASTQIIDLLGRTATPGLIDSHLHFNNGVESLYAIDLSEMRSIKEVVQAVRDRVAKSKPGDWIRGNGWDEGHFVERRYVLASDLDQAAPANPVWLGQTTGHYGVANSVALKLAHITAETKDPPASTIDRDSEGRPTGVLKEQAAMRMVNALIPPYTREQRRNGVLKMIADLNREGMTAAKVPGIGQQDWEIYQEVRGEKRLSLHLFALWTGGRTLEQTRAAVKSAQTASSDGTLISGGIKLFMDGSGGARTAWMYDDWNKNTRDTDTGNRGYPITDPEVYQAQVRLIHGSGLHIGTHAIGDRAIDFTVDAYAAVLKDKPVSGMRHSIIHANIPTDHAIATMASLQKQFDAGYPEAQSTFTWWIGDTYAANFGLARSLRLMPFHTYLARGVQWAGGSDYPVTPFPARYGIWASIVRRTLSGTQPFGTAESVDVHTALRSYTTWAAHQLFLEKKIGSIEPGKDADIAVWDRDLYTVKPDEIKDMKCEITLFQGRVVYRNPTSPIK